MFQFIFDVLVVLVVGAVAIAIMTISGGIFILLLGLGVVFFLL